MLNTSTVHALEAGDLYRGDPIATKETKYLHSDIKWYSDAINDALEMRAELQLEIDVRESLRDVLFCGVEDMLFRMGELQHRLGELETAWVCEWWDSENGTDFCDGLTEQEARQMAAEVIGKASEVKVYRGYD